MDTSSDRLDSAAVATGSITVADHREPQREGKDDISDKPSNPMPNEASSTRAAGRGFSNSDDMIKDRPFFMPIGEDGVTAALEKLNTQLRNKGKDSLLSKKRPGVSWIGHEVPPGRYPSFPLRNWWAREWCGTRGLSDIAIEFKGLTMVQVYQNQAAVVSDPRNRIFVIVNSGFVAYAVKGTYNVLAIVDRTHLENVVRDPATGITLGSTQEVKTKIHVSTGNDQEYVVALFLNIPAKNCAILQCGDDLELLPAGQHCITNPNVTLRGLYTLGENQLEMQTKSMFTRDQVPVNLRIHLKWKLVEPLKLTSHGYSTPFDALRDKTQSIITRIVADIDYSSMAKQRSLESDYGTHPSFAFIDALRTRAMDETRKAALEYGIELRDIAVIEKQFKGEMATILDKLTTKTLQAQVEAANVDRENSNKVGQEQGALAVARIKAEARRTQVESEAHSVVEAAKAQAEAIRLTAEAEAEATRIRAAADAEVVDRFAQEMGLRRVEVSRVRAFGDRTVFVPSDGLGNHIGKAMALGMVSAKESAHGS